MPRVLLTDTPLFVDAVRRDTGLPEGVIHGRERGQPKFLRPCTPYALGEALSADDDAILADLAPHAVAGTITRLCRDCGGGQTLALAEAVDRLQSSGPSVLNYVEAAADVAKTRIGRFSSAIELSQQAILDYHQAVRSNGPRGPARDALRRINQQLSQRFRLELTIAHRQMSARYRTLSSADQRLADMVRHTRKVSKLDIASRFESGKLAKLGRNATHLGNGLVVVDFGSRLLDIKSEYDAGGDWGRKMFVESSSFAASLGAGWLATEASVGLLGAVVAATPVGWVLIVGGLAAAATVAVVSTSADDRVRESFGPLYDAIMRWLSGR